MLILVRAGRHPIELSLLMQFFDRRQVDREVAEWRGVGGTLGQGASREVFMMGGSKQKNTFSDCIRVVIGCDVPKKRGHTSWTGPDTGKPTLLLLQSKHTLHV